MKKLMARTVQKAVEKLGNLEKTELDPNLKELLERVLNGEPHVREICDMMEVLFQPNATKRFHNSIYDKLNRKLERTSIYQDLGQSMKDLGQSMSKSDPYFDFVISIGINEKLMGQSENELCDILSKTFFFPIKDILEIEYKAIHHEKTILEKRRLDLEIVKGKLRKVNSATESFDKLNLESQKLNEEFMQQQERVYKMLVHVSQKLFYEKSYFQEFVSRQTHFHKKSLEYLDYAQNAIDSVQPTLHMPPAKLFSHSDEPAPDLANVESILDNNELTSTEVNGNPQVDTNNQPTSVLLPNENDQ